MTHRYFVEVTDTFAGQANYAMVAQYTITVPDWDHFSDWDGNGRREPHGYQQTVMRKAKKVARLTGMRGVTEPYFGGYMFTPYKHNIVMFVVPIEDINP